MGEAEHYHQMLEKLAWVEMIKKDFLAKFKKKKNKPRQKIYCRMFSETTTLLTVVRQTCSW